MPRRTEFEILILLRIIPALVKLPDPDRFWAALAAASPRDFSRRISIVAVSLRTAFREGLTAASPVVREALLPRARTLEREVPGLLDGTK